MIHNLNWTIIICGVLVGVPLMVAFLERIARKGKSCKYARK